MYILCTNDVRVLYIYIYVYVLIRSYSSGNTIMKKSRYSLLTIRAMFENRLMKYCTLPST